MKRKPHAPKFKNGIGGNVADPVFVGNGTGNGAGDELGFVNPGVVSTQRRVGLVYRAVQEPDFGIFYCHLQGGPA